MVGYADEHFTPIPPGISVWRGLSVAGGALGFCSPDIAADKCHSLKHAMKLVPHHSFDDRQQALTVAILEAIATELKKAYAPRDLIEELTGAIAFAVTSLLDDSASVGFADGVISPTLTFKVGNEELAYAGGNTWMHEYVYRLLPSIFHAAGDMDDA